MDRDGLPKPYSLKRTLALWLAVTAPTAGLVWGVVPLIVAHVDAPPVVISLLSLLASGTWTSLVTLWALRRDGVAPRRDALGPALWLTRPTLGGRRLQRLRLLGWTLLLGAVAYVPLVVWHVLPAVPQLIPGPRLLMFLVLFPSRMQPGYTRPLALADPALAHAYWFVPLALVAWAVNALLAEELFFRGLLLPRLWDPSGRSRVALNGLLYFAYCLVLRPFTAPVRLIYGLAMASLACRFRSSSLTLGGRALEGLAVVALAVTAVSTSPLPRLTTAPSFPYVARRPKPVVWWDEMRRAPWPSLPKYQAESSDPWQLDLRGKDLARFDLAGRADDLLMSTFDATTVWPASLPPRFSPLDVLELGKNPGLGVRRLHARGITGRGVGIGIVDMPLLVDHVEIAPRLRWYEEINTSADASAQMHGPAVASIAVGRSLGVAPDAALYFLAFGDNLRTLLSRYQITARGIQRLVAVNRWLSPEEKIRVISISQGWTPGEVGYEEVMQAISRARAEGIFVIYCSMERDTPLALHGLGRDARADPDQLESFGPGLWWQAQFVREGGQARRLLTPMDSRTTASPTGADHYVFYRRAGWSWVAPYIAGLYALALQVDPQLTGERFWDLALKTGRTRMIEAGPKRLPLGRIVDPETLIDALVHRGRLAGRVEAEEDPGTSDPRPPIARRIQSTASAPSGRSWIGDLGAGLGRRRLRQRSLHLSRHGLTARAAAPQLLERPQHPLRE